MTIIWSGRALNIFTWCFVALSFIILCVRLWVDFKGYRKVAWYRDVMVFIAWAFFLAWASVFSVIIDYNYWNWNTDTFTSLPHNRIVWVQMLMFVAENLFIPVVYLVKVDLLLLFHELSPRALNPKMFWAICFGWFWTAVGFLMNVFWDFFSCTPISLNWTPAPEAVPCAYPTKMIVSTWVGNIISDVVIYAIPVAIIYNMQMLSTREKLSAGAMFGVGFLNVAGATFCCAGQIILDATYASGYYGWAWAGVGFFMIVLQMATAIWVVCMPHIKTLYNLHTKGGKTTRELDAEKASPGLGGSPGGGSDSNEASDSGGEGPGSSASAINRPSKFKMPIKVTIFG